MSLAKVALLSSVFDFTFFNQEMVEKRYLPEFGTCFGTFCTIRRTPLDHWPTDIHGCIGWWHPDFLPISKDLIIQKTLDVTISATFQDSRHKYFTDTPLYHDPLAAIEIDMMLLPLIEIDSETGYMIKLKETFNNDTYGLIYTDEDGNRATFLPRVFESISWQDIRQQLQEKARGKGGHFVAYRIQQQSLLMNTITFDPFVGNILKRHFLDFLSRNDDIPFAVRGNKIVFDPNEIVRNAATLSDAARYSVQVGYKPFLSRATAKMEKNDELSLQAKSFLVQSPLLSQKSRLEYCREIAEALKIKRYERQFEFGELVKGSYSSCSSDEEKDEIIEEILSEPSSNVFQLNWDTQALASMSLDANVQYEKWIDILKGFNPNEAETNYLVVILEGLSNLDNVETIAFPIFLILLKDRMWWKHTLLTWKDRPLEARLDITCHFLNSFLL